jgi:hypothetical protein
MVTKYPTLTAAAKPYLIITNYIYIYIQKKLDDATKVNVGCIIMNKVAVNEITAEGTL